MQLTRARFLSSEGTMYQGDAIDFVIPGREAT